MTKFEKMNQMEYMMNHTYKTNPIKFKEKFDFYYFHSLQIIEGDQSNKDVLIDTIIQNSKMSQEDKLKLKQRRRTLSDSGSFRKQSYRRSKQSGMLKLSRRSMPGMPSLISKNIKMEENESAREKKEFNKYKHIKSIADLKKEDEQLSRLSGTELFNYFDKEQQTMRTSFQEFKSTVYSSKLKINLNKLSDRHVNDNLQNTRTRLSSCTFKPTFRTIDVNPNSNADVNFGFDTKKPQGSTIFSGSTHPKSISTSLEVSVTNRQKLSTHRSNQSYSNKVITPFDSQKYEEADHKIKNIRKCLPIASKVKRNTFRTKAIHNKEVEKQRIENEISKISENLNRRHNTSIAIKTLVNENGKSNLFMAHELLNKNSEHDINKPHLEFISESLHKMKDDNRFHSPLKKIKYMTDCIRINQIKELNIPQTRKELISTFRDNKPVWLTPKPIKQNKFNIYQILLDLRCLYRSFSMDSINSSIPYLKLKFNKNKLKKHQDLSHGKRLNLKCKINELLKQKNLSTNYSALHIKKNHCDSNLGDKNSFKLLDNKKNRMSYSTYIKSAAIKDSGNSNSSKKVHFIGLKQQSYKTNAESSVQAQSFMEKHRKPKESSGFIISDQIVFSPDITTEKEDDNCAILNYEYLEKYTPDQKSKKEYIMNYFDKEVDVKKIADHYFYALLPSIRPSKLNNLNKAKVMQAYAKCMAIDIDILLEFLNNKYKLIDNLVKASDPTELKKFYKSRLVPNFEVEFNKMFSIYPSELQNFMKTQYIKKYGNPINNYSAQLNIFMKDHLQERISRKQQVSSDMEMIENLMKEYSLLDRIKKYSNNIKVVGKIKILDVPQNFKEKSIKNPNFEFEKQLKRKRNAELMNYQNYLACPKSKLIHKLKGYEAFDKSLEYLTRVQNKTHNKILNLQKFYKDNSMYVDPSACVLEVGNFKSGE